MASVKVKTKEAATERRKVAIKRKLGNWIIVHRTEDELMEQAEKPMPMTAFQKTMDLSDLESGYWTSLFSTTLPKLKARMKKEEELPAAEAERVRLFEQVYARGFEAFGNEEKFKRWLEIPSGPLEHKKPRDLMKSTMGLQRVMGELEDIAYGTYA